MGVESYDIIIIGGGVMGSSIAYHLLNDGLDGKIVILEKDPTYEYASTSLSVGGIRQQFSTKVNIDIGLYGIDAIERFDEEMTVNGEPANADFRRVGYLLLGGENNWEALKKQHHLQESLGVDVELLTPEDIKKRFSHLNIEDLHGGSFGSRAGYTDPYGILRGFLRKAKFLGANYIHEKVTEILRQGDRVYGIKTEKDKRIEGKIVVISAGPWAAEVGAMAGVEIPVDPSPKMVFQFDPAEKFDYIPPFFFTPHGLWCRPETGFQFILGKDGKEKPGFRFEWDRQRFEETLWPELARFVPSFASLKLVRGWGGLYAVNRLDHNAILGAFPGVEGLYVAAGFSGHGLSQSPAVGKGMSELIRTGRYETIDLSPLGAARIFTDRRVVEKVIF